MIATLPQAARPLVGFSGVLRAHGFPVAPEQTISFIEAVGLLGPRRIEDIYQAARALFGPGPERLEAFDALFRAFFLGQTLAAPAPGETKDDEDVRVQEDGSNWLDPLDPEDRNESGQAATAQETLTARNFAGLDMQDSLRRFARAAKDRLPRRTARRWIASTSGKRHDLARALRAAVRRDGEVLHLPLRRRKRMQRRIVLLIDVSGSMKTQTEPCLRFAHVLARTAERAEFFTLGTRLTRITRALRLRHAEQALARTSGLVADWDGGTRLGDALLAFLAVPRFAGFARGALVLVISDGLERGDSQAMIEAMTWLSRLAWRIDWLSPLATSADFKPETAAMRSILPFLDRLGDGSSLEAICGHVLALAKGGRP